MKIIEVHDNGRILWMDEEIVSYRCDCGEEVTVDIYGNPNMDRWEKNKCICKKCGRIYFLKQSNDIFEIIED